MARLKSKELISQREYARRRGVSPNAVNKAVKAGRISLVNGKIDPYQADRDWIRTTDQSRPRNRITGRPKASRESTAPSTPMDLDGQGEKDDGSNGSRPNYAIARAKREEAQAQLAELELEHRRGELLRVKEVRAAAYTTARQARDQLIALPDRVSAILAGVADPTEIHRILEDEIDRICKELSNGKWNGTV